ncbi:MAG: restriction endonuclease [bacterium]
MPVPDFQTLMLPMLQFASDGGIHSLAEARESLAGHFELSEAERAEMLPSGRQRRFDNRVAWAKVYLERGGLLASPKRAHFEITSRGRDVLAKGTTRLDIGFLDQFEEFGAFRKAANKGGGEPSPTPLIGTETPEEVFERAYQTIRSELAIELLAKAKSGTPQFFERLVVELLLKMDYGRNRAEAGRAIGRSGDEGIDGIITEDRLGLETIYIQAKRYAGTVGRPDIQKFVGALHGKRARKGVFITTGTFSVEAADYVERIDPRVVLIDGRQLAEYMIDYNLGVTTRATYELKRVDSDYFADE